MNMSVPPPPPPQQQPDSGNDRGNPELRASDCNLSALCEHIKSEGFDSGSFPDIVVRAKGSTYRLHRLILSRSSYFRNMLQGPWKESNAQTVTLHVDDENVNEESIAAAFAYLYGHHPQLNENNAFRVLAAASFLDLQDLCAICTDFITSRLWTSNFLEYQVFAQSQDYGIHGERIRNACWGYLCQSGSRELKEVLPRLSSQVLHALLTSDELWVSSEEKRFELALYALLAKGSFCKTQYEQGNSSLDQVSVSHPDSSEGKGKSLIDGGTNKQLETEVGDTVSKDGNDGHSTAHNILNELADYVVDLQLQTGASDVKQQVQQADCTQSNMDPTYTCSMVSPSSLSNSFLDSDGMRSSSYYAEMPLGAGATGLGKNGVAMEGPSEEGSSYHVNNNCWVDRDQTRHCSLVNSSCDNLTSDEWGRCDLPPLSWGGRIVGKRPVNGYTRGNYGVREEEDDTFSKIFEGGSLLYCNMSFEALINARRQLEELGFPCKAINDGLWLQMLLSHRVLEIGAVTCKNCCLTNMACACKQSVEFSRGSTIISGYGMQGHDLNNIHGNMGNVYIADPAQGRESNLFRPARIHVRGAIDGLAGIGHGSTSVSEAAWPPSRVVFSRLPFGMGNRNDLQPLASDDSEARAEHNGDVSGDGLTALVELSQGVSSVPAGYGEHTESGYETNLQSKLAGAFAAGPVTGGIPMQMLDSPEHAVGIEWDNANNSSISLDLKTPLIHFPPFRFGVEFEDVHKLSDGQVKHSAEVYYAGSLWKVSIQAFNDEDPQGRRTLGLFIHRRKAEISNSLRKVQVFVDSREKVNARYQLICPSKREVLVVGTFKQTGTLLPKAPKGWGWRTALLFDELADFLQNGSLRVAAVVQLV